MKKYCFYSFLCGVFFLTCLFGQMPYYGPSTPNNAIQVQLMVYDQPDPGVLKIESVIFNGRDVSLKPPDLNGFRGGGGFQLPPGRYTLEWKVSRDTQEWPRTLSFKKTIDVKPRNTWVQITIKGDTATVL